MRCFGGPDAHPTSRNVTVVTRIEVAVMRRERGQRDVVALDLDRGDLLARRAAVALEAGAPAGAVALDLPGLVARLAVAVVDQLGQRLAAITNEIVMPRDNAFRAGTLDRNAETISVRRKGASFTYEDLCCKFAFV